MPFPRFAQLPKIIKPIKGLKHLPKPPQLTQFQRITHKVEIGKKTWRIFTGDLVEVIAGPEKGKQGKVKRVYRKLNKVLVEGINQQVNPIKALQSERQGLEPERFDQPLWYGQVNLVDPSTNKPTKIMIGYLEDGSPVRVCKDSGVILPKPSFEHMKYENKHKNKVDGAMDTVSSKVFEITYKGEDFEGMRNQFLESLQKKEAIERNLVFDQ